MLYSRFSLVTYFIHSINSVYMSTPISQFFPAFSRSSLDFYFPQSFLVSLLHRLAGSTIQGCLGGLGPHSSLLCKCISSLASGQLGICDEFVMVPSPTSVTSRNSLSNPCLVCQLAARAGLQLQDGGAPGPPCSCAATWPW